MTGQISLVDADTLSLSCQRILEKVGVPEDQAATIAAVVVEADLRGIGSHGVLRLPAYVRRVLAGTMTPKTDPQTLKQRGATLLLDAQCGFGQIAAVRAMNEAIDRAQKMGTGFVAVRNAGHFGIAAYYSMMALKHEMIGMVFANTSPSMAAWGGTTPLLGTNPISVAIPTGGEVDIVLDMASSVVARGKIRLALKKGEQIPEGWAVDAHGVPTTDPAEAMKGTLQPIGGPKGYGLALVADILSGALTGSNCGMHIASTLDYDSKVSAGFVVQAIDISAFADLATYYRAIQEEISDIYNSPRAPGVERIFLPGEIEALNKKERLATGIPVPDKLLNDLRELAKELGAEIELPRDSKPA